MELIAYKCLECGHYTISKYDGKRCVKCNGHLISYGKATFVDSVKNSNEKMKLVLKNNDKSEVEIKEIQAINKECKAIILFVNAKVEKETIELAQKRISELLGKKVLILDNFFAPKIYSVM